MGFPSGSSPMARTGESGWLWLLGQAARSSSSPEDGGHQMADSPPGSAATGGLVHRPLAPSTLSKESGRGVGDRRLEDVARGIREALRRR